jgi:hypothetical protein
MTNKLRAAAFALERSETAPTPTLAQAWRDYAIALAREVNHGR